MKITIPPELTIKCTTSFHKLLGIGNSASLFCPSYDKDKYLSLTQIKLYPEQNLGVWKVTYGKKKGMLVYALKYTYWTSKSLHFKAGYAQ